MKRICGSIVGAVLMCSYLLAEQPAATEKPVDPDHAAKMVRGLDIFKKSVRPLLTQHCLKCHGGKDIEAGFDLSDRAALLKGGDSGPAVILGKSRDSLFFKLIAHAKEPFMPHKRAKLPDEAIAQMADWIDNGAPYEEPLVPGKVKDSAWTTKRVPEDAKQFWSFQPLRRVPTPVVKNETWSRTAIDRFILAKQEAVGLTPQKEADRRTLIRRAYFDLIGLPPSPQELEAALGDPAPDAYEKLIDQLLSSKHHGERWARHWLDLARFAESHGFEHDYDRPTAYHYRDFVIRAFNDDLPYDTFVKWQIAGDEIAPANHQALMATGFLAAGVHSTQITKNEVEKHRYDELDDMVATIGTTMLGLTVGCARCHDHKFDPMPQRDYYRMLSSFTTTVRSEVEMNLDPEGYRAARVAFEQEHQPLVDNLVRFENEQMPDRLAQWEKGWEKKPEKISPEVVKVLRLSPEERSPDQSISLAKWHRTIDPEWKQQNNKVQEHLKKAPALPKVMVASEGLPPLRLHTQGDDFLKETHFLRRGDPAQKEGVADSGYLQVLTFTPEADKHWQNPPPAGWRTSYRRRAFADWMTDVDQGAGRLLARVIVNRLWQHHMGRGIVATPSDFGHRGDAPSHPELLDWLATELIANGWRLKPIHKLIMTSAVYRQTSQIDEARVKIDHENRLCWRRPAQRLQGETLRDALLCLGDTLDTRMYGPGTLDEASKRRSIYFTVKRSKLVTMMQVFDAPDALGSIGERPTTTIAPQALLLMNNANVRNYAKSFAHRIAPDAQTKLEDAVQAGYRMALSRPPSPDELADSVTFVKQQMASYQAAGKGDGRDLGLADFCQVLMCLNDFVYVD